MSSVRRQSLRLRGHSAAVGPLEKVTAPQAKKRPQIPEQQDTENVNPSNIQKAQQVCFNR